MRRICLLLLALCLLLACGLALGEGDVQLDKWNDFTHTWEGDDMPCSVYLPAAYAENRSLPLITYIPDSSLAGKALSTYKRAACTSNWAKADKMAENPAAILIIRFSDASSDVTDPVCEASQILPIIEEVVERYGLDHDRLYLTGQSMGGIMDFALNDAYPDVFRATLYVGCQMGGEVGDDQYNAILEHAAFASQKMVYIVSRLDGKAPYGQDDVEAKLSELGVPYRKAYDLDKDDPELNARVTELLRDAPDHVLLAFPQVTPTGDGAAEHMQSFKYAYAIDALYAWLLAQ